MVVGILLATLGAIIVLRGLNYGSQHSGIQVGDFRASVETQRAIPTWVGGVAIVGGVLLVGTALRRRRGA